MISNLLNGIANTVGKYTDEASVMTGLSTLQRSRISFGIFDEADP